MAKILVLSIIVASIALPVRAAREKNPRQGLRRALINVAVFNLLYILFLRFVYAHL